MLFIMTKAGDEAKSVWGKRMKKIILLQILQSKRIQYISIYCGKILDILLISILQKTLF